MHELRTPLNNLLKKEIIWDRSDKCQSAFEEIKKILTSDWAVAHFDAKLEIAVAADTSESGLGVVIQHKLNQHYTNLFLTRKQTDHVRHLIWLVEKGEVILNNMAPKCYLPLFVENYYWALSTNLGTRLLRQEKTASRKVSSLAS